MSKKIVLACCTMRAGAKQHKAGTDLRPQVEGEGPSSFLAKGRLCRTFLMVLTEENERSGVTQSQTSPGNLGHHDAFQGQLSTHDLPQSYSSSKWHSQRR